MESWVCDFCLWTGPEYKLVVAGKGITHYYTCPRCSSTEVSIVDDGYMSVSEILNGHKDWQ
jgi:Zn finger protein HypA/HybF involved in hydrogenase expression